MVFKGYFFMIARKNILYLGEICTRFLSSEMCTRYLWRKKVKLYKKAKKTELNKRDTHIQV